MVSVRINGEDTAVESDNLPKIADLIELIKSMIDPDHMITSILIDGRDVDEHLWSASPSTLETSILEIETGDPGQFVAARLISSPDIVRACFMEFRDARKHFQDGNTQDGNRQLATAVNTLQAFFEWYGTMMDLVPEEDRSKFDISAPVQDISEVCKKICQQQLYQSWWALGESLKNELEPKLDVLEDHCRKFGQEIAA